VRTPLISTYSSSAVVDRGRLTFDLHRGIDKAQTLGMGCPAGLRPRASRPRRKSTSA
jgi:hypothetical protein